MNLLVLFSLLMAIHVGEVSELNVAHPGAFPAEDTFRTYVWTPGGLIVFAYEDSTELEVLDGGGTSIWSGVLDEDQYYQAATAEGVFSIIGTNPHTILLGDPIGEMVNGWFAMRPANFGVGTKFHTVIPEDWGGAQLIVFAQNQGATHVAVRDFSDGSLIDSAEIMGRGRFAIPAGEANMVTVTADNGISVLSHGDQGYWVPADNGRFTGTLFYTWIGYIGEWQNDLNVVAYEDETHVIVKDSELGDTLWEGVLDEGDVQTVLDQDKYVTIESDKDIACLVAPYVSYTSNYARFYAGRDIYGQGIGFKFYHPTISGGQLHIFSYHDDNHVTVQNTNTGSMTWQGTMDEGEHHVINTANTVYLIESDWDISVFDANGSPNLGVTFADLWATPHPAVSARPDQFQETVAGVPVSESPAGYYEVDVENNGNMWDIINIFHENSHYPDFTSEAYDENGDPLPDTDGDGNPDTGRLPKGGSAIILVDVFPSETVPVNTIDTCFLSVVSARDDSKVDIAILATRIRSSMVDEEPVMQVGMKVSLDMITNTLHLSFSNIGDPEVSIRFFDASGRKILSQVITESQTAINVSDLPRGVYFVSARIGESERILEKIVVCH